jgi:hypothetical protein
VKYLLQVRFHTTTDTSASLSEQERDAVRAQYLHIRQDPLVLDAHQLQPAHTATTVRIIAGRVEQTPQVPLALEDALDGYYLLDAPHLEAAVALAAQIPAAATGGSIEIRPVLG